MAISGYDLIEKGPYFPKDSLDFASRLMLGDKIRQNVALIESTAGCLIDELIREERLVLTPQHFFVLKEKHDKGLWPFIEAQPILRPLKCWFNESENLRISISQYNILGDTWLGGPVKQACRR